MLYASKYCCKFAPTAIFFIALQKKKKFCNLIPCYYNAKEYKSEVYKCHEKKISLSVSQCIYGKRTFKLLFCYPFWQ